MAPAAQRLGHAARLEVDRLETAAPDAPPARSAGVASATLGRHRSAAVAAPRRPSGTGSPLGPSARPPASGSASGAVGGHKGRCAQRQQRHSDPAAAETEARWPLLRQPQPQPHPKALMPCAAVRREEVDQSHLVLREELLEIVGAQLLAQLAVGLVRVRGRVRGRGKGRGGGSRRPAWCRPGCSTAQHRRPWAGLAAAPRPPIRP